MTAAKYLVHLKRWFPKADPLPSFVHVAGVEPALFWFLKSVCLPIASYMPSTRSWIRTSRFTILSRLPRPFGYTRMSLCL